jgi:hypothetical protein
VQTVVLFVLNQQLPRPLKVVKQALVSSV